MRNRNLLAMQENDFCIQELTLFLDTHPGDEAALRMLTHHLSRRPALKEAAQKEVGPLTNYDNEAGEYSWVNNPWPWDKED